MTQQAILKIVAQPDGTYPLPPVVRVSEEIGVPTNGGLVRLYLTVETGDELELPVTQNAIRDLKSAVLAAVEVLQGTSS